MADKSLDVPAAISGDSAGTHKRIGWIDAGSVIQV
jgi:hypothetical protein